eukprot:3326715-Rhodomonas_salina.1
MALPTVLTTGEHVLLEVPGTRVLQTDANALILPHAPLERGGCKFLLRQGNATDPSFGGFLRFPDGRRVQLRFQDNLYYLP